MPWKVKTRIARAQKSLENVHSEDQAGDGSAILYAML
jgi:hypothetical protein